MTVPADRPVVDATDTTRAREVLEAWLPEPLEDYEHGATFTTADLLELRGLFAVALTEARRGGYQDGYADGVADGLDS